MVTLEAVNPDFEADEEQVLKVQRLVSHNAASLDYTVDRGPRFTVTIRDREREDLVPGILSRLEEIIGGPIVVAG